MAISFIQKASNGAANAGPVTVTFGAALTAGDFLIAYYCDGSQSDKSMPTIVTPANMTGPANELYSVGASFDVNSALYWKFAAGGETSMIGPDMVGTADGVSLVCMVFRGVKAVADGGPFSTAVVTNSGASGNPDPSQIATAAGDVVVTGVAHASSAAPTFTAPTNYATNADLGVAGADTIDGRAGMAYRASGYANPENPGVWTLTGGTTNEAWTTFTAALAEASAPATPLTVQDAAVAVSIDSPALTQHNILVVQDVAVAPVIDNVVLFVPGTPLIVQDVAVAPVIDNVVLTQHNVLAVQDAAVAVSADNVVLSLGAEPDEGSPGAGQRRRRSNLSRHYNRVNKPNPRPFRKPS